MITLLLFLLAVLVSPFRSSSSLFAENVLLRHQVMVLRRKLRDLLSALIGWQNCLTSAGQGSHGLIAGCGR